MRVIGASLSHGGSLTQICDRGTLQEEDGMRQKKEERLGAPLD